MLNISALNIQAENPVTTGLCTFNNLNATPFHMVREDGSGVNAGISFSYEGGKMSCPIDPDVAFELQKAADRHKLTFSRVDMEVCPAAFGKEKRAGIKPLRVVGLYCGKVKVYPVEAEKS